MFFRGFHRPGQGFKLFKVLKRVSKRTDTGRPVTGHLEPQGSFFGIIAQASPTEREQARQSGHPITHTIVQRGTQNNAVETDVLELNEPGNNGNPTRRFLVQTVQDPGELGHFLVYKVEERMDLG